MERAGGRFVSHAMDNPYRLPIYSVATFAAIMLGVFLGNGAISAINPVHFQGAAVHPRDRGAAVDPNAVQPAGPEYPLYGFAEGRAARQEACNGCVVPPRVAMAAYATSAPYFGSREERRAVETRELSAIDEAYRQREARLAERDGEADRVERYMHYPVAEAGEAQPEPSAFPEKEEEAAPVQE